MRLGEVSPRIRGDCTHRRLLAERDLAALARQLEAHELDDVLDARLVRDRVEEQRLGEVVRLSDRDQPAQPGDAHHLRDRRAPDLVRHILHDLGLPADPPHVARARDPTYDDAA
jgi:hypothetical protein